MSVPLKRLATVIAGQSPASDEVSPLGDGLPFIQGNAEFGARSPSPRFQCANAPKKALPGDVLVSVRAPVGEVNVAPCELGIGRGVAAVRASGMNANYLYWFLQHSRTELTSLSTGSTFTAVTASDVGNLLVPVLDYAGQTRIADYLDRETATIDTLIEKQRKLSSGLLERRAAAINHVLAQIDAEEKPLGLCVEMQSGLTLGGKSEPEDGVELPYLRVANIQTGFIDLDRVTTVRVDPVKAVRHRLQTGDVLMTEGGDKAALGRGALWRGEIDPCLHQNHVFCLRPDRRVLDPEYLVWILEGASARQYFEQTRRQTTNLSSTNTQTVRKFRMPLPSVEEQRTIADRLDAETAKIDALIAKAERFIELAQERRAALITAAVTGQIEVPEAGATA